MKLNVGSVDRVLRILLGLVIAIIGVVFESWWGLIGVVFIITGLISFCPIYFALKLSTRKKEN